MIAEPVERRALGALRLLDAATGLQLRDPLSVTAPGAAFSRNRRGLYVIWTAPGLETTLDSFQQPPAVPAPGAVALTLVVSDPGGRYLSRRATIHLPLDPDPQHTASSLFLPIDVPVYPGPAASTAAGWALVRASVTQAAGTNGLAGALLRVVRSSDSVRVGLGLTDARGEGLVVIPGIPVTTWDSGSGPVLATEVDATVQAVVDPAASGVPDPDDLEARHTTLRSSSIAVKLASGRELVVSLAVTVT